MDFTPVLKYSLMLVVVFAVIHMGLMQVSPDWSMGHAGIFTGVAVAGVLCETLRVSGVV